MGEIIEGRLNGWRDFMLRCEQATRRDQGATIIEIKALLIRGEPVYWSEPKITKIEPAAGAKAFFDSFDGAGTA